MFLWIIKGITDICWYLAILEPVRLSLPKILKMVCESLPIVYGGWMAVLWKQNRMTVVSQKQVFFWECRILVVAIAVNLIYHTEGQLKIISCIWIIIFALSGIFQLRLERLDEEERKDPLFLAWNGMTFVLVALAAAFFGSSPVLQTVVWIVKLIYFQIIVPILMGIVYLIGILADMLVRFLSLIFPDSSKIREISEILGGGEGWTKIPFQPEEVNGFPVSIRMVFWFLAGCILCMTVVFLYKKLVSAMEDKDVSSSQTIVKRTIKKEDREVYRRNKGEENLDTVRRTYQKFLLFCKKQGMSLEISDTSEEVKKKALVFGKETGRKELEGLRELYIAARYRTEISEKEKGEEAEEFYKRWKSILTGRGVSKNTGKRKGKYNLI